MAVSGRVYPVDRLLAVFNVIMAAVWLNGVDRWGYGQVLAVVHMVAAGLPLLLRRASTLSGPGRVLRQLYPMVWLMAFWTEVDFVRRLLHDRAYDALIIRLEDSLFGIHLHEVWMPRMHDLWISEILHMAYFAYYFVLAVPVVWLLLRGRQEALMDTLFRLMATLTVCFLFYLLMPVDGPRHTGAVFDGPNARGLFARLVDLVAVEHGESLGAAFPSSHVAASVTVAWVARHHLPRWAFRVLALEAVGVFLATFYTQQHYAIDALAGVLLALVLQGLLVPLALASARARDPRIPGLPPLPPGLVVPGEEPS